MESSRCWILISFMIAACKAQPQINNPPVIDPFKHLSVFQQQRYPLEQYQKAWIQARKYIANEYYNAGLTTYHQYFQTEILTFKNTVAKVDGYNIIGEFPSYSKWAPVFMIGAYYDSTLTQVPVKENGVAMAVLLETARNLYNLKQSGSFYYLNTSILFVAFDLNVKNYIPQYTPGKPGSTFFVRNWLPYYMWGRKFVGALILDSISSFNPDANSQIISEGLAETFRHSVDNIRQSDNRANFLALVSRSDQINQFEVQNLISRYHEVNPDGLFRMEDFTLPDGVRIPGEILDAVTRNPVHDFWTFSPPLPAMFLTDMANTRRDFDEANCAETCPLNVFWSQERSAFVGRTAEAILQLVLRNQQIRNDHIAPVIPYGTSSQSSIYISYYWSTLLLMIGLVSQ